MIETRAQNQPSVTRMNGVGHEQRTSSRIYPGPSGNRRLDGLGFGHR